MNKQAESHDEAKFGTPPKSAIVQYHDQYEERGIKVGKIIATWRVYLDRIEKVDDPLCEPKKDPRSGMYFNEGHFLFSINQDSSYSVIGWFVGPRYGRGSIYKIIKKGNEVEKLVLDRPLWIS